MAQTADKVERQHDSDTAAARGMGRRALWLVAGAALLAVTAVLGAAVYIIRLV